MIQEVHVDRTDRSTGCPGPTARTQICLNMGFRTVLGYIHRVSHVFAIGDPTNNVSIRIFVNVHAVVLAVNLPKQK